MFERQGYSKNQIIKRDNEISIIAKKLGAKIINFNFPTAELNSSDLPKITKKLSKIFTKHKPHRIYTVNRSDSHSDHRITFQATMASSKIFRHPYIKEILMYECISETEFAPALSQDTFTPNLFIDISKEMNKKVELVRVYESEIRKHPFPRSVKNVKALATFRGATSGVKYAESFQIIKIIEIG